MHIDAARYEGGQLILSSRDPEARALPYKFKPGQYTIAPEKKKRSINANDMMWSICENVAKTVGTTKEAVYRRNIKEVGVYEPLPIRADALPEFSRRWESKGTGWFVEVIDDSKLQGYKTVFAYYGSSTYLVSEMSRLIDSVIQDANSVGIDVISEREKSILLEAWDVKA